MPSRFSMTTYAVSTMDRPKGSNTDLICEIFDLGHEFAMLDVHFSTVLLEIVDRALVQRRLRTPYPFKSTEVFVQTPEHLPHGACLLLDVACIECRVRFQGIEAVHDCAIDGLAAVHIDRRL